MKDKKPLIYIGTALLIVWVGYQLMQYYRSGAGAGVDARFSTYADLRKEPLSQSESLEMDGFYATMEAAYEAGLVDSGSTIAGGSMASGIVPAVTMDYLRFVFEDSKGMAQSEVDASYGTRFGSSSVSHTASLNQAFGFHSFPSDFACRHYSKALLSEARAILQTGNIIILKQERMHLPTVYNESQFESGQFDGVVFRVELHSGKILGRLPVHAENSSQVLHSKYVRGDEQKALDQDFKHQIFRQTNAAVQLIAGMRLPDLEKRTYGLE